jgi:hypothetical protein
LLKFLFAILSYDHPSGINFFDGSNDLFDIYIPLTDLADEEVDHLDVANSDGDNEVGNDSEDNPGFY